MTRNAVYVLRQAGLPADHATIRRGIKWLKSNQRESGRWFVRSLNTDKFHYITNAGTSYAVMAIKVCEWAVRAGGLAIRFSRVLLQFWLITGFVIRASMDFKRSCHADSY